MIHRKIDNLGDWEFGHGLSNFAVDDAAIALNIKTRLLSWVNDCFFAIQEGVDWRQRLDIGQQQALSDELKTNILQSFGVIAVNSFTFDFDGVTRLARITYNIQTIFSPSFQTTIQQAAGA